MRRISVLSFFVVLALSFAPRCVLAADTTTGGISPAMSPDEIKSKLGPDWQLAQTANIQRGKVFNFTKGQEGFSLLTLGPRIVFIEHQQFFPPDGLIVDSEMSKALDAKYGSPTVQESADGEPMRIWALGSDGNVLGADHAKQAQACADYEMKGPFQTQGAGKVVFGFNFPTIPVKPALKDCGTVIVAKTSNSGENARLISRLVVSVFDVKAANDWYTEAMDEYNQQKDDEIEAAKKNKPNL